MIVNFPDEAAATICFSIESLILLDNCYHISLSSKSSNRRDATYLLMSSLPDFLSNFGSDCDSSFTHCSCLCPSTRYLCFSFILCCSLCHLVIVLYSRSICARDRQIYYQNSPLKSQARINRSTSRVGEDTISRTQLTHTDD
jgi:hypothetical protein